jgi:hypothetical protein
MTFVFQNDPEFLNFNFSWLADDTLQPGSGPRESDLYVLVQKARKGIDDALQEYEDAMSWTLRPAAFESFQRTFGARAIEYPDWFYSKLYQFFRILLHERVQVLHSGPSGDVGPARTDRPWEEGQILYGDGPSIDPDDLETAFSVDGRYPWHEFVKLAVSSGQSRVEEIRHVIRVLADHRTESKAVARKAREWSDNVQRDRIILDALDGGKPRREICQILDQYLLPTTDNMRRHGCATWLAAWNDKQLRRAVQSLFSKVTSRKAVKG